MIKLERAFAVVVAVMISPAALAVNITFDSGSFNTNGNAVTGNINDTGSIPGMGTHSRFATDGSTLTMGATSSLAQTGFQDLGWTMTYTNTANSSTTTGMTVFFMVLNPIT